VAVVIGDDDKKMLYWTDGIHPQMGINVEKALNTAYGYYGDSYSDHNFETYTEQALSLIKAQPDYCVGAFDSGAIFSNEVNALFTNAPMQFSARYVYDNHEVSKWSTVSYVSLHDCNTAVGVRRNKLKAIRYAAFTSPIQSNIIASVQYAFRTTRLDRWRIFATVPYVATSGANSSYFYGTELMEVLDDLDFNKLYDAVPITSGTISSLKDNRLILADNVVGYPNVGLDVVVSPIAFNYGVKTNVVWRDHSVINTITKDLTIDIGDGTGYIYCVFKTPTKEYVLSADRDKMTVSQIATHFAAHVTSKIVGVDPYITSASNTSNKLRIVHTTGNFLYGKTTSFGSTPQLMKVKNGVDVRLGIVYYDLYGRMGYVNEVDQYGTHVPFYTEQTTFTNNEYLDILVLTINHRPPKWAYYWGIFWGYNNPKAIQLAVKVSDFNYEADKLKIRVDQILNDAKAFNPEFRLSYQFTPGDRIRWIGKIGDFTDGSDQRKRVTLFTDYIDGDVFGYGGDFNEYLVVSNYSDFPTTKAVIEGSSYVLIEIYTPSKQNDPVFYYETPYKFPIRHPGTDSALHDVTSQQTNAYGIIVEDQTTSSPAICYIDRMDHRPEQHWAFDSGAPVACMVDSDSFSNYIDSNLPNIGKPHIVNPNARQIRLNTIQWSDVLISDSQVNGLSTFDAKDEKQLDDKYGRICGLEVTGDILNIIQKSKISSAYLGAELSKDLNGNDILVATDDIIGSIRPAVEIYGSSSKYSIQRYGNYVYGYDIQTGIPWRKSFDGVDDLSVYKMQNYFRDKLETLKISGIENIRVVGGFNAFKKTYYLTFIDSVNSANNETVAFHEPSNRWISFYSFIPDFYGSILNVRFLSFKNGGTYLHNVPTVLKCHFYGVQYGSEIWAVYNQFPTNSKIIESIIENANSIWDMPDNGSIIVDADSIEYTNPIDYSTIRGNMQSRLKSGRFRNKQGEYHARFLRDMTTSSTTASQYDLFNGRKLRGKTVLIKLKNSVVGTSPIALRSITITANA
jgi:hypothetical protein